MSARGSLVDRCPHCQRWIQQRTGEQSSKIQMQCIDLSRNVEWPKGSGLHQSPEAWKQILMAAFEVERGRPLDVVPGLNGGQVIIFRRTSRLSKQEASEFIEFAESKLAEFGIERKETEHG